MLNIYQFNYVFIVESNKPENKTKPPGNKQTLLKGKDSDNKNIFTQFKVLKLRRYGYFLQFRTRTCHVLLNYKIIFDIDFSQHQYDKKCSCSLLNNPHLHLRKVPIC